MITAFVAAFCRVAVTVPAVGVPLPTQTSTLVCARPPHWLRTRVQVSPRPLTAVTAVEDLHATAAR